MNAHSPVRGRSVCPNDGSRDGSGGGDDHQPEVRLLEQQIAELRLENAQLREAAKGFGELAERLNELLRKMEHDRT
jgi:uncharacterized protein involved in exopolysaccharide biosynthesis